MAILKKCLCIPTIPICHLEKTLTDILTVPIYYTFFNEISTIPIYYQFGKSVHFVHGNLDFFDNL